MNNCVRLSQLKCFCLLNVICLALNLLICYLFYSLCRPAALIAPALPGEAQRGSVYALEFDQALLAHIAFGVGGPLKNFKGQHLKLGLKFHT